MRGAGRFAPIAAIAIALSVGCQDKKDQAPVEQPKAQTAIVTRANPVCALGVECGLAGKLWTGPDNSKVHLTITGAADCPASVTLFDRQTQRDTQTVLRANAGQTATGTVTVPGASLLRCLCGGTPANPTCTCRITGVDPPLPPNVVLGPTNALAPGPPVTDPAADATFAVGTTLNLSCGKTLTLWSGPESYVTATFKGSQNCFAKLTPERAGHGAAGGEEITDDRPWARTFGPITKLTASCQGAGAGRCQFAVTETIRLP